jgi:outer membrane receptor protein involved in Fe transport
VVKGGVTSSSQNLHAIRTTANSFPFDRYAITSTDVKPEKAWQYSVGYTGTSTNGMWEWSAESYYKDMRNVYDYRSGVTMFSDINLDGLILGGKGRSYGMELMFRKNVGRLTGWVSYTLSKTQTKIDGINDNRWYDASNDRRHDLNIVAMYDLTDRWRLSASFLFASGQALSVPDAKYQLSGETFYYYSQRNNYRTPNTHRLDISANYRHIGKKFTYEWSFGVYNIYNHYNPYAIYFEDCPDNASGTRAVQYSMYGFVPSVSYNLKF